MREHVSAKYRDRESRQKIPVVNICRITGVESGLPREEQERALLGEREVVQVYDAALERRALPIVVGIPHAGELIPQEIVARVRDVREFVEGLDRGTARIFAPDSEGDYVAVQSRVSRVLVDVNRRPDQRKPEPGEVGGVTRTINAQEQPIYREGQEPTEGEIVENVRRYYEPYYEAAHSLLDRLHGTMGYQEVLYLDVHSFTGGAGDSLFVLGDKNHEGASEEIISMLQRALTEAIPAKDKWPELYDVISNVAEVNTKFKGGHSVDYFGHLAGLFRTHAIQLEMNMAAFFRDGKYDFEAIKKLRVAVQKAIKKVGKELQK